MDSAVTWHDLPDGADFYPTRMGGRAGFSIAVSQRAFGVIRPPRSVDGIALTYLKEAYIKEKACRGRAIRDFQVDADPTTFGRRRLP